MSIEEIIEQEILNALIPTATTTIISSLEQVLTQQLEQDNYYQVLFKDTLSQQILSLQEIFEFLEIETPEEFWSKIKDSPTLFIYSNQTGNRFGFIAEIQEQGLENLMTQWENTITTDLIILMTVLADKEISFPGYFKTAELEKADFRYIDSTEPNFGICYGFIDNYFLFTTSGESMIELIGLLTGE